MLYSFPDHFLLSLQYYIPVFEKLSSYGPGNRNISQLIQRNFLCLCPEQESIVLNNLDDP